MTRPSLSKARITGGRPIRDLRYMCQEKSAGIIPLVYVLESEYPPSWEGRIMGAWFRGLRAWLQRPLVGPMFVLWAIFQTLWWLLKEFVASWILKPADDLMPPLIEVIPFVLTWVIPVLLIPAAAACVVWAYRIGQRDRALLATGTVVRDMWIRDAVDQIAIALGLPGDRKDEAFQTLVQFARDGHLAVWGIPQSTGLAPDSLHRPAVPIKPEHWDDFDFDVLTCLMHPDPRECKTEPRSSRSLRHNEAYVALQVSRVQINKFWPVKHGSR